jgi:hypothetical protein
VQFREAAASLLGAEEGPALRAQNQSANVHRMSAKTGRSTAPDLSVYPKKLGIVTPRSVPWRSDLHR